MSRPRRRAGSQLPSGRRRDPRRRNGPRRSGRAPRRSAAPKPNGGRRRDGVAASSRRRHPAGASFGWLAHLRETLPRYVTEPQNARRCAVRGVWCAMILAACAAPPAGDPQAEIVAMLGRSASDWNRGDLAGFMSDYAHDSLTSYVSAGHVVYGWQRLFDRYQTTYFAPGKSRDSLAFEEVRVRPL